MPSEIIQISKRDDYILTEILVILFFLVLIFARLFLISMIMMEHTVIRSQRSLIDDCFVSLFAISYSSL